MFRSVQLSSPEDIHRYLVEAHQLLTNAQFAELYTLAQVAPGPNAMYVTLIGWHLAGWKGVAATTIPLLVPAITLTMLVGHLNERYPNARFGRVIRRGLMTITIGLVFASAAILMRTVNHDWRGYLITFFTVAVVLRMRWNPLWLFAWTHWRDLPGSSEHWFKRSSRQTGRQTIGRHF